MIVKDVRVDWLFVYETGKQGKYGCTILLPKGSPQEKQVIEARDKAIQNGIANNKFTQAHTKSATFKMCVRDGDAEIETEGRPAHYKGMSFINCSNSNQPGLVDENLQPIMDRDKLYSGCYVNADVNIAPFYHKESGSRGIGAYIQNVMFLREGERLDGRQSAEEAFAGMEASDAGELQ